MSYRAPLRGLVILLAVTATGFALCQEPPSPRETAWFALMEEPGSNGKLALDRIALVSEGKLLKVPDDCSSGEPAYKQFFSEYLNAGHAYSVLFGGTAAGSVVIRTQDKESIGTVVDYKGSARIRGMVMGLATNAITSRVGPSARQTPTPEERQSALNLAKSLFEKAGVPRDLLPKIKVNNLTRTLLLPSKSPGLIGSFSIDPGGETRPTHNLFFIAGFTGSDYVPELVWTRISKDEVESASFTLVDQADLFGDGEEEVIVLDRGWEGYAYRIFRRAKNDASHWEMIFETGIFGCA